MGTFRVIPNEVKEQILNRIKNDGITAAQAARESGIPDNTVYGWLAKSVNGKTNNADIPHPLCSSCIERLIGRSQELDHLLLSGCEVQDHGLLTFNQEHMDPGKELKDPAHRGALGGLADRYPIF